MRRFLPLLVFSLLVVSLICAGLPSFGAGVVTNASQADLQAAMASGGTVDLEFNGVIWLTNAITVATNIVCDASGYNVTISGSNAVQLFIVPQSVTFVLSNLVLADGLASGSGGAISNTGTVQVIGCLFTNNGARGQQGGGQYGPVETPGQGGAIFNAGILLVSNASFVTNWAEGGQGTFVYDWAEGAWMPVQNPGQGGAIFNAGALVVTNASFLNNWAGGALAGLAQNPGQGGAIFNAGILLVTNASFLTNWAEGGNGSEPFAGPGGFTYSWSGGSGNGGAIYNTNYALIDNCLFDANSAIGGSPGGYPDCGGVVGPPPGPGAAGADASGGAIYNSSTIQIIGSIISSNNCTASAGGDSCAQAADAPGSDQPGGSGGDASGAGLFSVSGSVSLRGTTFFSNVAFGGNGGAASANWESFAGANGGGGGQAAGGGVSIGGGMLNIVNCTFVSNTILAGMGADGAGGDDDNDCPGGNGGNGGNGAGGAICVWGGSAFLTNATFVGNVSTPSGGGQGALGSGQPPEPNGTNGLPGLDEGDTVARGPGFLTLLNSILSCAPGKTNAFGPITDAGYNLNSDASGFLTNSTSLNGVDPKLGTLGNYGGPTPTLPLLPGSIAIDHADPASFPPTDQRGYPRPFGSAPDIGSFEYWPYPPNSLSASIVTNGMFDLVFWGTNGQRFTTLASDNLSDWSPISTNTIASSNWFEMFLPMNDGWAFYQTISP